ncbi:MAG: FAD-dependent oxidoreductase [Rhodobacter sp.]|nr:FAD-dependent oxidoreductase [Rhodobacter sp.]
MDRVVIIGGGAIGLSLAYHLAGRAQVTLLERNTLTSGTSWHAAGIVGPLRASANMTRLAMEALTLFPALEVETGMSTGYRRTGGHWLARVPERMDELHRIAAIGRCLGLSPRVVERSDIPGVATDDLAGALVVAEDAHVNPVDLCMAYARAARSKGAVIRENTPVSRIVTSGGAACGVALGDGTVIGADRVAICAGAWSKPLTATAGVALPLQPVEHMYVVTQPMPGLAQPFGVLRDLDAGLYVKGDAGRLVIGGFEPDAKCWDAQGPESDRPFLELAEDWDQFAPFMAAALRLIPSLANTGIQRFMNGPESFTADTRPLIGEVPQVDGLFVAAGMNSVGIMSSAGVGRVLADWIFDNAAPMDLWEVDVARADPRTAQPAHLRARMAEAVADQFALHWPFRQPRAGRGLRKSVLHDRWAGQGAVFGLTGGWERALWYARSDSERDLPYSIGAQPWFAIARREAAVMDRGTALLDLSPFGKFDISGPDALRFANRIAAANVDVPPGRVVYTPLLNPRGGIEADVTIARIAADRFRMTSGAATRWRDAAWLRRNARGFDVTIADRTEEEAVIGVMGAGARRLLKSVCPPDWQEPEFGHAGWVTIDGASSAWACRMTRLSFVGEPGCEVSVGNAGAGEVFDALIAAGGRPMGHHALDACRLEKGFRHWGHDLGPDITALEAGLEAVIDWSRDFIGREALLEQRAAGLTRKLVLFEVSGDPLMLHDEPVWEAGRVVGLTTSGARGVRTGKTLCLALVGLSETPLQERVFTVEVAGRHYPASALARPPFDPSGERMRS